MLLTDTSDMIALFGNLSLICLIAAIALAAVSVLLFLLYHIREVFNFLTGRTEKMAVQDMLLENAKSGKLRENAGKIYRDPEPDGKARISDSLKGKGDTAPAQNSKTEKGRASSGLKRGSRPDGTSKRRSAHTDPLPGADSVDETELLQTGNDETVLLDTNSMVADPLADKDGETALPDAGNAVTDPLADRGGETVLLSPSMQAGMHRQAEAEKPAVKFVIIKTEMDVHSEETI